MIEKATTKDYAALKAIGMTCFEQNIRLPGENYVASLLFRHYFSKRRFAKRVSAGCKIYVYQENGQILGFYELEKSDLLASLYVDPAFQHRGIGSALLEHAFKMASGPKMRLDSSRKAVCFYAQKGFKQVGKERLVFGILMVPMEKQLKKA